MNQYFNILVCAGGGVLCYVEILIIAALEKLSGKPCWQLFNALGGTSGGAINTAPLAIGVPAATVATFYTKWAPLIFQRNYWNMAADAGAAPKYSNSELIAGLQSLLTVTGASGPRQATLADCKTRWMATAFDCVSGMPVVFDSGRKSQRTPFAIYIGSDSPIELWQIVLSSGAAQTYFPGVALTGMVLIDGGNTGANAPGAMMKDLLRWQCGTKQMRMLSLGSGDSQWDFNAQAMISPSDIRAALSTIHIVFAAGVELSNAMCAEALANNYFHISPAYPNDPAIDDATPDALKILEAAAETAIKQNSAMLDEFIPAVPPQASGEVAGYSPAPDLG